MYDNIPKNISQSFVSRVYAWMFLALTISGFTAWFVFINKALFNAVMTNPLILIILFGIELAVVYFLSSRIDKMNSSMALGGFLLFSVVNGATLSVIFASFELTTIATAFMITAAMFGLSSLYGFVTKKDLTSAGHYLGMLLIGLLVAMIVNIFIANSVLDWIINIAAVVIFVGLTAYDTQKIKGMSEMLYSGDNLAIVAALTLYLDFVNLFLHLLKILGRKRSRR